MVDSTSIVVSVVALVASVGAATLTLWSAYLSDERKNRKESRALVAKYGDPLLLAAQDLQSRLFNLTDWRVCKYIVEEGDRRDNLLLYTAFVFGQWFSYAYILRRKTQFLRLETDNANKQLTGALTDILLEFGEDTYDDTGAPFMLWRGDQMAIGQVMTVQEGEELLCMGYAEFRRRCADAGILSGTRYEARGGFTKTRHMHQQHLPGVTKVHPTDFASFGDTAPDSYSAEASPSGFIAAGDATSTKDSEAPIPGVNRVKTASTQEGTRASNDEFRRWFLPIIDGVIAIAEAQYGPNAAVVRVPDQRLRRMQHLLVDLVNILDPQSLRSEAEKMGRCHRAEDCHCSTCKDRDMAQCCCRKCREKRNDDGEV